MIKKARMLMVVPPRGTNPWKPGTPSKHMTDRLKAIVESVNKNSDEKLVTYIHEPVLVKNVHFISTGTQEIDDIFSGDAPGTGHGIAKGRIVEIYGKESSGKTTLALMIAAGFQAQGYIVAFVDAEHALDLQYAQNALHVNTEELLISLPMYGEQALDAVEKLALSGKVDLIIVDSVAALVPKKELDGEMGRGVPGEQAKLMSQACRKLTGILNKTGCTVIFLNQVRMKIGVFWGNPEVTSGGNALLFYASTRIHCQKTQMMKEGGKQTGTFVRVRCTKSKVSPPYREGTFILKHGFPLRPAKVVGTKAKGLIK